MLKFLKKKHTVLTYDDYGLASTDSRTKLNCIYGMFISTLFTLALGAALYFFFSIEAKPFLEDFSSGTKTLAMPYGFIATDTVFLFLIGIFLWIFKESASVFFSNSSIPLKHHSSFRSVRNLLLFLAAFVLVQFSCLEIVPGLYGYEECSIHPIRLEAKKKHRGKSKWLSIPTVWVADPTLCPSAGP